MKLRLDFDRIEHVDFEATPWVASPSAGVERKLLERDGDEVGHATSFVRYAPGSRFGAHTHDLGEEFLVVEGTFQDERGAYPAETYVRNPPGSRHAPFSESGCVLFVKLRQLAATDDTHVLVHLVGSAPGTRTTLHAAPTEEVSLLVLAAGAEVRLDEHGRGLELVVLAGDVAIDGATVQRRGWYRRPGSAAILRSSVAGSRVWIKRGHLRPRDARGPQGMGAM